MKNLKRIVFGLLAMLVMVTGVNAATCNMPEDGKTAKAGECTIKVNGIGYLTESDGWTVAWRDGGSVVLYTDNLIANGVANASQGIREIAKSLVIDLNGHSLTLGNYASFRIDADAKLTIKNGDLALGTPQATAFVVAKGGALELATLNITGDDYNWSLVSNAGSLNITGDVNVNLPKANVLYTAKANATATIDGTYKVNTVVAVDKATTASDRTNPASTALLKGDFTTASEALTLTDKVVVTVDGAVIESAQAAARVTDAELVVTGDSELIAKGNNGIIVEGTSDDTKLTVESGSVVTEQANCYALVFRNDEAVYSISGGTFESADNVNAAILLDSTYGTFTETKDGETHVVKAIKGILTGGKYLNNIIAKVLNSDNGTVDVSEELVAEGYTVKVEDPYKLVVSTTPADEPSTDEPAVDPSGDGEPAGDETEGKVPSTFDGIASIVTMAISSVSAAGYSIKKIIRK